jgi:hypothetical protein
MESVFRFSFGPILHWTSMMDVADVVAATVVSTVVEFDDTKG